MPFERWGRTFYRPAELRVMTREQREEIRAEHRANPVPQEVLRAAYPDLVPAEDEIDRELREILEAGE